MKIQRTTLANGLRIVTAEQADARSVTAEIMVGAGSRDEGPENNGASHYLEHLLFKGSRLYPTPQHINRIVEGVGGFHNAYTMDEMTSYFIKLPGRHLALALRVLADMVANPILDPAEVDRERGPVVEEKHRLKDDPESYGYELLPELLFAGHPLEKTVIGPEAVIKNLPLADIRAYHQRFYIPNNMVVAVAGQVQHEEVVRQLTATLGSLPRGTMPEFVPMDVPLGSKLVSKFIKKTEQAHLLVAARSYGLGEPRDHVMDLLATILGGGSSSRLYDTIRERQGLAYSVYAYNQSLVDTGCFTASVGANLDKTEQALGSLLHELERIRHEPVDAEELDRAKQCTIAHLEMHLESNAHVAGSLASQLIMLDKLCSTDDTIAELEAVTVEQVQTVAREVLAPERLRLAVVAPKAEAAIATKCFKAHVRGK